MKTITYALALVGLWALYYVIPIEYRLLWQPDETRYAEISRGLLASGDWVVPHFLGIRYFEKPIAGYWINSLGQWIFGHSNFAVRAGVLFSSTLTACLVAWISWRIWRDKRTALLAAVIYLSCLLVYGVGTYAVLDPMLALWLTLGMCSFWYAAESESVTKKVIGYVILGVACGMGVMTKGFLALAVPVISVLPWVAEKKQWKSLLIFGPLAVLSAAAVTLPWALTIAEREPTFWHYFFWVEHIQRFAQEEAQHRAPFWYYLPVFLLGALPWLGFLPGALYRGWCDRKENSGLIYLLGWVIMPLLFFSLAKGKLLTYILPCYAPLAALLAHHALRAASEGAKALRANAVINMLFGFIGLLAVLLVLAPHSLAHYPLFTLQESGKVLVAATIFFAWLLVGFLSFTRPHKRWFYASLCPLALALLIGFAIPDRVVNAKQPQAVLKLVDAELQASRYVLSNSVGVASAIAWELQRDDIFLYSSRGELEWGLQFEDSAERFVSEEAFPAWLAAHRQQGNISLMLLLDSDDRTTIHALPTPDRVYQQGRFAVIEYYSR
ncbi:lipid IV(A) 4-amino-4-deoxy-L-arabinosyltransferase [Candidatus Symbiopectobacterium sp. NZEC135]|uniref:lipid IV(A) 4-amino-4-deoxy-L-arabinosyltransferase n=1 Tax=Candidatus Symbiopectobacterium sp. NZEC135 TaxID=2820471 RepID=UPI0022263131|nr:lipid IV(A) 4-amino-4-deoxy-L-arabinosyltransferase [Candidatus Symbiopectobacterium sp. NZEC135]MCW2481551.1 lipid IV(A) 4-amino-4-deoxy-L-arabinosyltransferase [Candidatus Symbiopectobacterium sp. NZEC135]